MSATSDEVTPPTTEELTRTAYHEAGHAVFQHALTLGCKGVTIEPDYSEMTAGAATHGGEYGDGDDDTFDLRVYAEEAFFTRHATMAYAGAEATRRWDPARDDWRDGADSDFVAARDAIDNAAHGDEVSYRHLDEYAKRRAQILVEYYWPEIDAVAKALLRSRTLTGEDIAKVFMESLVARRGRLRGY